MNAHAAIKNTFLEDFSVQKCLTIILLAFSEILSIVAAVLPHL